jgi:hypothetical protein
MTEIVFLIVAIIFALIGNGRYLIDVLKGKTKPHPYTWLIWSIVSAVVFFGQLVKGAGIGAIPTFIAEIFTIIIFFFSLRFGFKNIPKKDHYFLALALIGIIPWLLTKDPTISVIIVVLIDIIAFTPTLHKTWKYPASETSWLYGMNVLRHIITLFLLESHNIATTLHSIDMIIINSLMVLFIKKNQTTILARKNRSPISLG